jgi:hypothetical protein
VVAEFWSRGHAGGRVLRVTILDFLLARSDEDLRQAACTFEDVPGGAPVCRCERPTPRALELLARRHLIHRWSRAPEGRVLLRLLADDHATHDDYRPEWH